MPSDTPERWLRLASLLPCAMTDSAKRARKLTWDAAEANGNGYLSLKETVLAMQRLFARDAGADAALEHHELANSERSTDWRALADEMRKHVTPAFNFAMTAGEGVAADGLVEWNEFRYFMAHLKRVTYHKFLEAVGKVDFHGDSGMNRKQLIAFVKQLETWG